MSLCVICMTKKATVPDKNRPGKPVNRFCLACHEQKLIDDLQMALVSQAEYHAAAQDAAIYGQGFALVSAENVEHIAATEVLARQPAEQQPAGRGGADQESRMNVTYQNGWAVPAGWKLVPIEPTYELESEVGGVRMDEEDFLHEYADHEKIGEICRAVVKYSPPPPKAPDYNPGPLEVSVIGMPEFDALLDHIYEEGTGSEGAVHLANKLVRTAIQSHISYARNTHPAEQSTFTVGTDLSDGKLMVVVMEHEGDAARLIHTEVIQVAEQQPAPDVSALVKALKWLRGAINATPENDKVQAGTWISSEHPRIKQIDAILAAYRKQEGRK